jgi:hypothetical protein
VKRLAQIIINTLAVIGLLHVLYWFRPAPAPASEPLDESQKFETRFTPHPPECVPDDD